MSRALSALLRTSFELSTRKKDGTLQSLPLHRAVLDAVIARDPGRAEKAIRVLIEGAHLDIQEVLSSRTRRARLSVGAHAAARAPARTPTSARPALKKKIKV
jgi:DNA-binding GntR family transcriptional regulator